MLWYFVSSLLLADFITGFFHWLEDNYCKTSFKGLIQTQVCGPNLRHHIKQTEFLKNGFFGRNYVVWTIALVPLLILLHFSLYWWSLVVFVSSFGSEFHAWCHKKPDNWFGRLLQDMCIVTTAQQHSKHHKKPHKFAYCNTTNLLNPILDRLKFWRFLENIIWIFTGRRPNWKKIELGETI